MKEPDIYIRNPVAVRAVQITTENMTGVAKWCGGTALYDRERGYVLRFGDNSRDAKIGNDKLAGDWIIKGQKGELYACSPGQFLELYTALPKGPGVQVMGQSKLPGGA